MRTIISMFLKFDLDNFIIMTHKTKCWEFSFFPLFYETKLSHFWSLQIKEQKLLYLRLKLTQFSSGRNFCVFGTLHLLPKKTVVTQLSRRKENTGSLSAEKKAGKFNILREEYAFNQL